MFIIKRDGILVQNPKVFGIEYICANPAVSVNRRLIENYYNCDSYNNFMHK